MLVIFLYTTMITIIRNHRWESTPHRQSRSVQTLRRSHFASKKTQIPTRQRLLRGFPTRGPGAESHPGVRRVGRETARSTSRPSLRGGGPGRRARGAEAGATELTPENWDKETAGKARRARNLPVRIRRGGGPPRQALRPFGGDSRGSSLRPPRFSQGRASPRS